METEPLYFKMHCHFFTWWDKLFWWNKHFATLLGKQEVTIPPGVVVYNERYNADTVGDRITLVLLAAGVGMVLKAGRKVFRAVKKTPV